MKRMENRSVSLLLCVGLVLSLLTGCGKAGTPGESAEGSVEGSQKQQIAAEPDTGVRRTDPNAKDKEERVYVKADAEGTPTEISVETVLKNPGDGAPIRDRSTLSDLKNTEGDEEFTQNGTELVWDNNGADIHYKGISTDQLPVEVRVSYYLDGEAITPDRLAGCSGRVRIRYDYENTTKKTVTVQKKVLKDRDSDDDLDFSFDSSEDNEEQFEYVEETVTVPVPFTALTALFLPSDQFSNVEVTNGEVLSLDDQIVVMGYALPGLADALKLADYEPTEEVEVPEYVELSADVTEFALDFSTTVVTNGLLEELETEDLYDADELVEGTRVLSDASKALADGTDELYDGLGEFSDYLEQYTKGVNAVSDGAKQLSKALGQVDDQKQKLIDGVSDLQSGLEALGDALSEISLEQLIEDGAVDEATLEAIAALLNDTDTLDQSLTAAQDALSQLESFGENAQTYVSAVTAAVEAAGTELDSVDLSALETSAKAQVSAALESTTLTEEEKAAILDSIDLSESAGAVQAHLDAAKAALSGLPELTVPELTLTVGDVTLTVEDMLKQLEQLQAYGKQAADAVEPLLPELEEVLTQLAEGADALEEGGTGLAEGLTAFSEGISQLTKGANTLSKGAGRLDSAGKKLSDGFQDALKGVRKLRDGLRTFDEEGIQKLGDLAGDDLSAVITRMKALKAADDGYCNFGGIREDQSGSVRFFIETAEIRK